MISRRNLRFLVVLLALVVLPGAMLTAQAKIGQGMYIRAFIGGPEGDAFASLIQHGIEQARADLGPKVDIIYSNWDSDLLLKQVREAIAIKPDGMAINGLPGHDALVPIARELQSKGILYNFIVVDSGDVHKEFGGGYFGVGDPYAQGKGMADRAIKSFGLKRGDRILVMGAWDLDQHVRESGVAETFEKAGCTVDRITITHGAGGINSDPNQLTPILTAYQLAHPETKLWSYQGGVTFAQAPLYAKAAGLKAGQVKMIGFDLNEGVISAFDQGYIQIASDQQPYYTGYLSIMSLVMTWKFGFSPIEVDTGAGLIDTSNYKLVAKLAKMGIR
ncbi:MAG TPA: substrate-binding domain-containing protein [Spirochaetia bacterium]|nr:substrate-binding domain-containing protein [Spirochaetia bacterium]